MVERIGRGEKFVAECSRCKGAFKNGVEFTRMNGDVVVGVYCSWECWGGSYAGASVGTSKGACEAQRRKDAER